MIQGMIERFFLVGGLLGSVWSLVFASQIAGRIPPEEARLAVLGAGVAALLTGIACLWRRWPLRLLFEAVALWAVAAGVWALIHLVLPGSVALLMTLVLFWIAMQAKDMPLWEGLLAVGAAASAPAFGLALGALPVAILYGALVICDTVFFAQDAPSRVLPERWSRMRGFRLTPTRSLAFTDLMVPSAATALAGFFHPAAALVCIIGFALGGFVFASSDVSRRWSPLGAAAGLLLPYLTLLIAVRL